MKLSVMSGSGFPCRSLCLAAVIVLTLVVSAHRLCADSYAEKRFEAVVISAAERHGLDPCLLKAVIWQESHFVPFVTGSQGEIGLMQIRLSAAQDWAKANHCEVPPEQELYDPYVNIEIGSWILARALRYWDWSRSSVILALGEYNAGRTRVKAWVFRCNGDKSKAVYTSVSGGYVKKILGKYQEYLSEEQLLVFSR